MNRTLASGIALMKFAALLAVSIFFITASYELSSLSKHTSDTLMRLNDSMDKINGKDGLIQELGIAVVNTKKLIELSNLAERKEISQLDTWNNQFSQSITVFQQTMLQTRETLAAIQGTSDAATGVMQTTQTTVQALQAPITQADADLAALEPFIAHSDALVTDPNVAGAIAHTNATMAHVDATTADVQQAVHKYLHPTLPQRILGWVKTGAVTVGQIIF